jgi:hypothetical protein
MPNMVLIDKVTVGSGGAAAITFTGIPQTYTDLLVKVSTRSTSATVIGYVNVRFNSDTGNNYSYKAVGGTGSITFNNDSTSGSSIFTVTAGNSSTSNTFGNAEIYIPNYASANYKSVSIDGVGENNATEAYTQLVAGIWSSTSAITSIQLSDIFGSANFAQYSTAYLYGVTSSTTSAKATGGTITSDGAYFYHTFTSSGTFTPTANLTADCLIVAGGGSGGGGVGGVGAGGGGAGGYRFLTSQSLTLSTAYTVTVGAGGAAITAASTRGNNGSNSVFGSNTSTGGGGGGGYALTGNTGGSGGGGGAADAAGGTGTSGQGNDGGLGGTDTAQPYRGGGGGGASAVGTTGAASGNGGAGTASLIFLGRSVTYAGGGGGGGNVTAGTGGAGGGGAGGAGAGSAGTAGTVNTGGGGGGTCGNSGTSSGAGGSGIVIVRYAV